MTLQDIISTISAIDNVSIQDKNGRIYNGPNGDFKATCEWAHEVLDSKVERIRAYDNFVIVFTH